MTWKKTAINSHSKQELLDTIADIIREHGTTISTAEIYTSGTLGTALAECTYDIEGGYKGGVNSPMPGMIASILKIEEESLFVEENASQAARSTRYHHETDYGVFVSEKSPGADFVTVCAVSKIRTYSRAVPISRDNAYDTSQVRYYAIYELARLMYNEVHQSIPIKERKKAI
jgi:hypothetical protein